MHVAQSPHRRHETVLNARQRILQTARTLEELVIVAAGLISTPVYQGLFYRISPPENDAETNADQQMVNTEKWPMRYIPIHQQDMAFGVDLMMFIASSCHGADIDLDL